MTPIGQTREGTVYMTALGLRSADPDTDYALRDDAMLERARPRIITHLAEHPNNILLIECFNDKDADWWRKATAEWAPRVRFTRIASMRARATPTREEK